MEEKHEHFQVTAKKDHDDEQIQQQNINSREEEADVIPMQTQSITFTLQGMMYFMSLHDPFQCPATFIKMFKSDNHGHFTTCLGTTDIISTSINPCYNKEITLIIDSLQQQVLFQCYYDEQLLTQVIVTASELIYAQKSIIQRNMKVVEMKDIYQMKKIEEKLKKQASLLKIIKKVV